MEHASFLRQHIQQIVTLSNEQFDIVLQHFTPKTVAKKSYLIKAGQKVTSEFLVVEGLLKTFLFDEKAKEHILQFAMENWWVSDYPAYAKQQSGDMCVQALENCIVLELSLADKASLCEKVPQMNVFFGKKSFGGYVALQKRVLSMMKSSPNEKYELLLEQYPQLFQRVSKTMIAHYLGVSRETLSRLHK
ncbi:Crp/Fnr family transcriptional regulator [Nubsella zeaxanthinifaciens]|uniref:Crp/Fnr family transcriptional regulator n=1 Tax=Nubsella zeaxanthinifaciens TaxID=392412 RepID=UPI003D03C519